MFSGTCMDGGVHIFNKRVEGLGTRLHVVIFKHDYSFNGVFQGRVLGVVKIDI